MGIDVAFIAAPFGKVKNLKYLWRFTRDPKKTWSAAKRSCGGGWRAGFACVGLAIGLNDIQDHFGEFMKSYDDLWETRPVKWFEEDVLNGPGSGCSRSKWEY